LITDKPVVQVSVKVSAAPLMFSLPNSTSFVAGLVVLNVALIGVVLAVFRRSKVPRGADMSGVKTYGTV